MQNTLEYFFNKGQRQKEHFRSLFNSIKLGKSEQYPALHLALPFIHN